MDICDRTFHDLILLMYGALFAILMWCILFSINFSILSIDEHMGSSKHLDWTLRIDLVHVSYCVNVDIRLSPFNCFCINITLFVAKSASYNGNGSHIVCIFFWLNFKRHTSFMEKSFAILFIFWMGSHVFQFLLCFFFCIQN